MLDDVLRTARIFQLLPLLILFASFYSIVAIGQSPEVTAEILSKRYSSGYFPVVDEYVEYQIRLTTADLTLKNQSLLVSFLSESNRTHSLVSYSMPLLGPEDGMVLNLGPFKMKDEGEHRLLLEMKNSDPSADLALVYQPDSFIVYRKESLNTIFIATMLIAVGAGVTFFSFRNMRKNRRLV